MLFLQLAVAQIQSAASLKIEVSINKTMTDFILVMNQQNATVFKTLNTEVGNFKKDVKNAIIVLLSTSAKVSLIGVNASASNYYQAIAKISQSLTDSASVAFLDYVNADTLASDVLFVIDNYKAMPEESIYLIREKVADIMAETPLAQLCLEKALKDLTTLFVAINKNITADFTLAMKNFKDVAKNFHQSTSDFPGPVTRAVNSCIAKGEEAAVYKCLDGLLLSNAELDMSMALFNGLKFNVPRLFDKAFLDLSTNATSMGLTISDNKDKILAKIVACSP